MDDRQETTVEHMPTSGFANSFFAPFQDVIPVRFGAASHTGKVRSRNEDHYAVFIRRRSIDQVVSSLSREDLPSYETKTYAMVVADGMGGMKSGEIASRLALQTMADLTSQATSWVMKLTDSDAQQIEERVKAYVERIHAVLREYGKVNPASENMGTTWTSAHLLGDKAIVVHVGDSRAYLHRGGKLHQLTHDETMAQAMVSLGIDPSQVKRFRHILLNSFGAAEETPQASIHELTLEEGDRLLLCTDGLTDMVEDTDIAAVLGRESNPQSACEVLVDKALENGGRDNITIVLAAAGP